MAKKITLDNLGPTVEKILSDYAGDISTGVKATTTEIAKAGATAVKAGAQANFNGKKYAKGWTYKVDHYRVRASAVIYNRDEYRLSHLLEKGHQLVRGGVAVGRGYVEGRPHIKPVEEEIVSKYERDIRAII